MNESIEKGKKSIIALGWAVIIYELILLVLLSREGPEILSVAFFMELGLNSAIRMFFGGGIIFAIYKRKNGARVLWAGLCAIGVIANVVALFSGSYDPVNIVGLVYTSGNVVVLTSTGVLNHVKGIKPDDGYIKL